MSFWAKRSTKVSNQSHASEYLLLAASVPYFFQVWSSCGISFESYGAFLITCSTALWLCDQGGTASDFVIKAVPPCDFVIKAVLRLTLWSRQYGLVTLWSRRYCVWLCDQGSTALWLCDQGGTASDVVIKAVPPCDFVIKAVLRLMRQEMRVTVHWSEGSLVRRVTGPKGHWSEGSLGQLVRRLTLAVLKLWSLTDVGRCCCNHFCSNYHCCSTSPVL